MAEYIEREAAFDAITDIAGKTSTHSAYEAVWKSARTLKKIPTADVVPVVHGRWDDSGRYTFPSGAAAVRCTNCGCALTESKYRLNNWNYCPVCGAKMDGGAINDG